MNNLPDRALSAVELRQLVIRESKDTTDIMAEKIRSQLDPQPLLNELFTLYAEADGADLERLEVLKFKKSILTDILKKCMPDLKAVEVANKGGKFSKLIIDLNAEVD